MQRLHFQRQECIDVLCSQHGTYATCERRSLAMKRDEFRSESIGKMKS